MNSQGSGVMIKIGKTLMRSWIISSHKLSIYKISNFHPSSCISIFISYSTRILKENSINCKLDTLSERERERVSGRYLISKSLTCPLNFEQVLGYTIKIFTSLCEIFGVSWDIGGISKNPGNVHVPYVKGPHHSLVLRKENWSTSADLGWPCVF